MRKIINLCFVFFVCFNTSVFSQFIENNGQVLDWDENFHPEVQYLYGSDNNSMFFESNRVVCTFSSTDKFDFSKYEGNQDAIDSIYKTLGREIQRIDIEFIGATSDCKIVAGEKNTNYINYFLNKRSSITNVGSYQSICYKNIYPNIDIVFNQYDGGLKYDVILHAGANIEDVKIKYNGAHSLELIDGKIKIETKFYDFEELIPEAYYNDNREEKAQVYYELTDDIISFKCDYKNINKLVIDPTITWMTYFETASSSGQISYDHNTSDEYGNLFISGYCNNSANDYPTVSPGGTAYVQNYTKNDLYIVRFNSDRELVWATYFGGNNSSMDWQLGTEPLAVDGTTLHVVGDELATNGPFLNGGGFYYNAGSSRPYYARFNKFTGQLLHCTNISGGYKPSIAVSSNGQVAIVCDAYDFNTVHVVNRSGAYNQSINGGNRDMFLMLLNSSYNQIWGTFLGGPGTQEDCHVAFDNSNNIFFVSEVSWTSTSNATNEHLVNPGSSAYYQSTCVSEDIMIGKFSSTGALVWNTLYGGNGYDGLKSRMGNGTNIVINDINEIVVLGGTNSNNLPLRNLSGAYNQTVPSNVNNSGGSFNNFGSFILKFSNSGVMQWATYWGGDPSGGDLLYDGKFTSCDKFIVCARSNTYSTMPVPGHYNKSSGGQSYLMQFDENFAAEWSSYVGNSTSTPNISFSAFEDRLYLTTSSYSQTEATVNPGGGAFFDGSATASSYTIWEFNIIPMPVLSDDIEVCQGQSVELTASGGIGSTYYWYTTETGGTPFYEGASYITPSLTGDVTYWVSSSNGSCTSARVPIIVTVTPFSAPTSVTVSPSSVCSGTTTNITLTASGGDSGPGAVVEWFTGGCGNTLIGTANPLVISQTFNSATTYYARYSGDCGTTSCQSTVVDVSASLTPTFTALGPYCVGATPGLLPGSSTNSPAITGTWSPATISTASSGTIIYTFTPTAGQCATTANLSVIVTQPAAPTGLSCYQTATWNPSTCVWDVTGTQPAAPTGLSCYQTATWNPSTCVWDVTGTQPAAPTGLSCYQTATWNPVTCVWDVTGTQPAAPTGLSCYQTATWNPSTCVWDVTGTQPAAPTGLSCYQTATWNPVTCVWDVTGTQPAAPTGLSCYQTATWNPVTCVWDVAGTQPAAPTGLSCYQTATWNPVTCVWDVAGTQPAAPTGLLCYQTATWNPSTCVWDVTGTQPAAPTGLSCYQTATWNPSTCVWDVTGTQPAAPTGLSCYQTATWNPVTCVWDVTGTQPAAPTGLSCYQTATWNPVTCVWDVTGTQPAAPTGLSCYQTATWNPVTCVWDVAGTQPAAPTGLSCYQTATWNPVTCVWDVAGTQPAAPTGLSCYETATWNPSTCVWDVTGTQPAAPTGLSCYQTATWNPVTCVWDVTGTQPAAPTGLSCYQTATWNPVTCVWDVTGTQPAAPTGLSCYQTATWNPVTCVWDVTGTQPAAPIGLLCYQTATWNPVTCVWDVTGTQPAAPIGLLCYQTATWNPVTCVWDVAGTQPAAPIGLLCYQTATWNPVTCVWDVAGTQPAAPTGLSCYQTATWNPVTCVWDVAGTQPAAPTGLSCYQTATWNPVTCVWDVAGTQPVQPAIECYETATWNPTTCVWDVTGTQPIEPAIECYETATWNPVTCVWDVTGTQPVQPAIECYETATWNPITCVWDVTGTPIPTATNPQNQEVCEGAANPALSVDNPGSGYQINWYDAEIGGIQLATNSTTYTPTETSAGVYTYYAEVEETVNGCASIRIPVTLTIHANPTISGTLNMCHGFDTQLTGSGMAHAVTPWTSSNANTTVDASGNVSGVTVGSSVITYMDENGCTTEVTVNVIENELPTFTNLGLYCLNSTAASLSGTSNNGYTGTWSPSSIGTSAAGTQTYTFTPTAGQCATTASMDVEIIAINLNLTSTNPSCYGENGSIGFTASGGSGSYTYTVNGSSATSPHSAIAGSYTVVVSDGTCSASQNVSLTEPDLLDAYYASTNVTCNGGNNGTINVTVEGGTSSYSFAWNDGATSEDRNGLIAGTYSVVVTDANGCSVTISNIGITQPSVISITGVITHVSCYNGSNGGIVTTTTGGNGGNTYFWSSSQQTANISGVIAGTYFVTATDSQGCTGTASFIITQPDAISISSQASNPTCNAATNGGVVLTVSGGSPNYTYQWNPAGTGGSGTPSLGGVGAGTYNVTVTDSHLCTSTATYILTDPTAISVIETIVNTTCDLPNGSISLDISGGTPQYTYQWDAAAQNATTALVSNLTNQDYSVTVTDANQCTIEETIEVGRDIPPTLSLVEQINETCSDSNAVITVEVMDGSPLYTYEWSVDLGHNSPTISDIAAGNHVVILTDADGCVDSLTIVITNHEAQEVGIVAISPAHCDHPDGGASLVASGGSGSYTYNWGTTPPRTSIQESDLIGGEYTVTVSDGVCDVEVIVDVPNLPGPSVNASANPSAVYVSKALIRFDDGSTGATSWYWDYGTGQYSQEQTSSFKYEVPGTYNVVLTATDDYGCSTSDTVVVVVYEGLEVWIPDAFSPNGDGLNDLFGPVATGMSLEGYEMVIIDRWGKEAFYTNDYYHRWDGTINGQRVEMNSVFIYRIKLRDIMGKEYGYSGRVSLIYGFE